MLFSFTTEICCMQLHTQILIYIEMIKKSTEEAKNEHRRMKKAAKKAMARVMREEAVRRINEIGRNPNNVFRLVE